MSQDIIVELTFWFHSFLLGILITAVYDVFLVLRRSFKHNLMLISLEDLLFWIGCAVSVFYMLYEENNGILRWFAILGAAVGMLLYKCSISNFMVEIMSAVIRWILRVVFKILRFICKPAGFLGRKVRKLFRILTGKSRKAAKCMKNRLTSTMKLLKITLCKQ